MVIRGTSTADVIDRILDKGIVIEYHADVSVAGIDTLITIDARWVVASIDTYQVYAGRLLDTTPGVLLSAFPTRQHS